MARGRTIGLTAVAVGIAFLAAWALRPDRVSPAGASPAVEAQLEKVLPEVAFTDVPFKQAVETLREQSGANILIDLSTLAQKSFDVQAPVDVRLRNVTVRQALAALIDYVGYPDHSVCYTISGERIVVTHRDGLGKYAYVRVYDVRDICVEPRPPLDPGAGNVCFFQIGSVTNVKCEFEDGGE
jgi:hypothetical protein